MQIGRFVFGIGGESLAVAQNTYAVTWFKGKELNMVFGFQVVYILCITNINSLTRFYHLVIDINHSSVFIIDILVEHCPRWIYRKFPAHDALV